MSLRAPIHLTVIGLCLTLLGCPPKDDSGDPPEADTDTDADADTDADTDVVWPSSFGGELSYFYSENGETVCDATIDLVGTAYTGTCTGCDFVFEMDAKVTANDGTDDCYLHPYRSYVDDETLVNMMMAHIADYTVRGRYGYYYYDDAFLTGFAIDRSYWGYGYYPGPYFWILSYDGSPYGTFAQDGDDIEWAWASSGTSYYYIYDYLDSCGDTYGYADLYEGVASDFTGSSDLDCDEEVLDVWTIELTSGTTVEIAVDTVSEETAFDPRMWFANHEQCVVAYSDDSFDCTYPPPAYRCPSLSYDAQADGTYQIVVQSFGACAGSEAEYQLSVDVGGEDPGLTQLVDNYELNYTVEKTTFVHDIVGGGTMTW